MLTKAICCHLLFLLASWLLVFSSIQPTYCDNNDDDYEPPFPNLIANDKVKIVSETSNSENGYRTDEEYVDFNRGKLAHVMNDKDGRRVVYLDAVEQLVYTYKPYKCTTASLEQFEPKPVGLFDTKAELMIDGKLKTFRAFGVVGLWLMASTRPKTFSTSDLIYSASQQMTFKAFTWTVKVEEHKLEIVLHFLQKASDLELGTPILSPQIIQLQSTNTGKTVSTFNILSLDYSIDDQVYEDLMAPPVGYACFKTIADAPKGRPEDLGYLKSIQYEPSLMSMEIVATKLIKGETQSTTSDVVNVELAYNDWSSVPDRLYLFKQKSQRMEMKTIYNFKYNVRYDIDSRRGTCTMSHSADKTLPKNIIKFNNDLELDLNFALQSVLFNSGDYVYMRSSRSPDLPEQHWFERNVNSLFKLGEGHFRLIRKYIKAQDLLDLQSVIIWKLNEEQDEILESYQLNMAEVRLLTQKWPDEAKVFDISEECYLNNAQMVSGRDYAWLDLTYPAPDRVLGLFSEHELELKRLFYRNIVKGRMDVIRAPKMELFIEEQGFIVRYLLLDVPSLELIYDLHEDVSIDMSQYSNGKDQQAADEQQQQQATSHFATDLAHCGQLCRLNYCTKMSFCPGGHTCLITTDRKAPVKMNPYFKCDTYELHEGKFGATFDLETLHSNSLHSIIARYQHQDYDIEGLPEQPEEVLLPTSETGLSEREYTKALDDYVSTLIKFLDQKAARVPELSLSASIGGHFIVLLPNKFEIENDPLNDFDLEFNVDGTNELEQTASDNSQQRLLSSFHEGMQMSKYKLSSVDNNNNNNNKDETNKNNVDMKQFLGLSYDQCATICLDGRCGSFSYCYNQRECIISSLNNTGIAQTLALLEVDPDCSIIQRDFLGNFIKFEQSLVPDVFREMSTARDPSECAMRCLSETQFNCLSFDYCKVTRPEDRGNVCFFQEGRFGTARTVGWKAGTAPQPNAQATCDHYSRSFLADFNRIDYRKIAPEVLFNLKTTTLTGQTVFSCAEKCTNELIDCTAFQFCFEPKSYQSLEVQCTLIESKLPEEKDAGTSVSTNGLIIKEGKNLVHDPNCQLYSLRKDSSEAQLRELALGSIEINSKKESQLQTQEANHWLLYLVITILSASIWCGVCLAKDNNELLRQKIERGRILLGIQ